MRHTLRAFFLALPVVLAAVACSKQPDVIDTGSSISAGEGTYLKINSVTTSQLAKSVIDGTSFPEDEEVSIGLFLEGDGFTDVYKNVKYTRSAGGTEWKTTRDIPLNDKPVTVYAYYPYDAGVDSIRGVKVASSIDGKDFMWATPVSNVTAAKTEVSLTFNHALAFVEISFNCFGYLDGTELKDISLFSSEDGFSETGLLDATNGTFTMQEPVTATNPFNPGAVFYLSGDKIVAPCLLVPKSTGTEAEIPRIFNVKFEFNSKYRSVSLGGEGEQNGVVIKQGTKSKISFTLRNSSSVSLVTEVQAN